MAQLPHRHLKDLLSPFMRQVERAYAQKPTEVLAKWKEVVKPEWLSQTEPQAFEKGTILVNVKNGALFSILVQHEGAKLLKQLQQKFPASGIKGLKFRMGA